MISLARSTLLHEWKRYLAAIFAVAFSGLLILVQVALLLGMFGTVSIVIDKSRADLWVANKKTESFDLAREFPARFEADLRLHPAVKRIEMISTSWGDWRAPDGSKSMVYPTGFNIDKHSLSFPKDIPDSLRVRLQEPGTVLIDRADARRLGVQVGDIAEIDNKRVKVVGMLDGYRNIGGAYVFMSEFTHKQLMGDWYNSDYTQYFLIGLTDGVETEIIRDELNKAKVGHAPYKVWLPQNFSIQSQLYWLFESGAGASFGFSVLLGLIVGVAITSQTLRGATLSSINEYATLRALGVSVKALRSVVVEQSFWVGVVGYVLTLICAYGVLWLAMANQVSMSMPLWAVGVTGLFTIGVALVSGLISLRVLYQTEPADLLR